ncbi:MAG: hypothetical protein EOO93_08510 [Pedobacter sp.]|nr:MAG: hypothetical protein EOO93_08510 [Pedobacter sp.]
MKKTLKYMLLLTTVVGIMAGCKRDDDYIKSTPSNFIANFDLRRLYKNVDLTLKADMLGGATSIKGVVISDFRSGNSPAGLVIMQNARIVGNGIDSLRGMAINIGADASKYIPGDSIHVTVDGATLKRVNGVLQIVGVTDAAVTKIAAGRALRTQAVNTARISASPDFYESTLVTLSNALYEPEPVAGTTYAGDKIINDGFGTATVHTEATASFANAQVLPTGNFTGIPFIDRTGTTPKITLWIRSEDDFFFVALPKFSSAIISGYNVDPNGGDGNFEYIQFLCTRDIDFTATPYSVIATNNAGATVFPVNGWITGGARTYKFNLTTGSVKKGEYFYVGGTGRRVTGSTSLPIPDEKWRASVNYSNTAGANGVGTATSNLLANSGNIAGIAIFEGTNVTSTTVPLDVIFYGGSGGNFYSAGPPAVGYRITNTEYYSTINPLTRGAQLFMGAGTNTTRLPFPNPTTNFVRLGGVYGEIPGAPQFGRWSTGRTATGVPLTITTPFTIIETDGTSLAN